jgi:PDZ domain-containing secreted protein
MSKPVDMIAMKSLRYATRRLLPDDAFEAKNPKDARLLSAIGKARYVNDADLAAAAKKSPRSAKTEAKVETKAPVKKTVEDEAESGASTTSETANKLSAEDVIDAVDDLPFMKWKSLASEILGEKTPGTKAEILAALEAHAKTV